MIDIFDESYPLAERWSLIHCIISQNRPKNNLIHEENLKITRQRRLSILDADDRIAYALSVG